MVLLYTKPTLFIISELTLKTTAIWVFYYTSTMSESIWKLSFVIISIYPKILALAIRLVSFKVAHYSIPILKSICAVAFFIEILELSFISLSFLISQHTESCNSSKIPFS